MSKQRPLNIKHGRLNKTRKRSAKLPEVLCFHTSPHGVAAEHAGDVNNHIHQIILRRARTKHHNAPRTLLVREASNHKYDRVRHRIMQFYYRIKEH